MLLVVYGELVTCVKYPRLSKKLEIIKWFSNIFPGSAAVISVGLFIVNEASQDQLSNMQSCKSFVRWELHVR